MLKWPIPTTVNALRGFLSLIGYYRKFIEGYKGIAAPITRLLKKVGFQWDDLAEQSFDDLKKAVTQPPALKLPDFSKRFVVECDASENEIGAILMQEGQLIDFLFRK